MNPHSERASGSRVPTDRVYKAQLHPSFPYPRDSFSFFFFHDRDRGDDLGEKLVSIPHPERRSFTFKKLIKITIGQGNDGVEMQPCVTCTRTYVNGFRKEDRAFISIEVD